MAGEAMFVSGGVTDAREARLASGGLVAVQGTTALDARTGAMWGPGSTALVTGTSATAPMAYSIGVHHAVTSRGSANGPYLGPTLDAATTAATTAAPASGSRIDVIYVKQQDSTAGIPTPDATTGPLYGVVQGTSSTGTPVKPSLPVGAEELATATVAAGATATNGAGVTITNTARQTVARGADIPVRNQAERDALTTYPLLTVKRLDTGAVERRNVGNTAWETIYTPPLGWTPLGILTTWFIPYTEAGLYAPDVYYRLEGRRVFLRGYMQCISSVGGGSGITGVGSLPAAFRPVTYDAPLFANVELSVPIRLTMRTDGTLITYRSITAPTYIDLDGLSWPIA